MLYKDKFYAALKRKFTELSLQMTSNRTSQQTELCMKVNEKYGFPPGMVSDIVTQRVDMKDSLEVLLYAIASVALSESAIKDYFTEKEIKEYSKYKYKPNKIKFPYTFESLMVEIVPEEQYVGRITAKELMKLRDAQVINYNINTQRTMTLKKGKDLEYYQITLNRKAVDQIADLYSKGDYIPNTLTFNLPPETDFTYANGKLTINKQTTFDILDGYHRYIAISNLYNINNDFDYPMEIRVMFRDEENAKQFIFQEDQRTPLLKSDSDAMNKNDVGVRICRFVKNKIGNDIINQNGIINESLFVRLLDILYVEKRKTYERSKIVSIANDIINIINNTLLDVPTLLDNKWTNEFTIMFFLLASHEQLKGKKLYDQVCKNKDVAKGIRVEHITTKRLNRLLAN